MTKKIKVQEIHRSPVPNSNYDIVVSTGTAWAVMYQDQFVQVRRQSRFQDIIKYSPTVFTQRGTALRLAAKLNRMFGCSDYKVTQIQAQKPL